MKNAAVTTRFLLVLTVLALALHACTGAGSKAAWHPVVVTAPAMCSDCHADGRAGLNHTSDFSVRHRFYALQNKQACGICHRESFCSDCHTRKEELTPSDRNKDAPERTTPHRGDYLNQHKIDGKIDPVSCIMCHGPQSSERCRVCHI